MQEIRISSRQVPYHSVHAMRVQASVIMPAKNLLFFKYYNEYSAKTRPEGRTIVFGALTLRIPKHPPPKK
ncbi:MAG: hypothetical protein WA700_17835 [Acidobacteriaceae bacterium]